MRVPWTRKYWLGICGAIFLAVFGALVWVFFAKPSSVRVSQSFPVEGVRKVILRAAAANTADVIPDSALDAVYISGMTVGGSRGYHPGNPFWRETPPADWGLDFVSIQFGDVLIISTKNEISYIHHHYILNSLELRVPEGIEVVRESRTLNGDGQPDLKEPNS
jgi:hypothetical protein